MHLALHVLLFSHLTFECEMQRTDNVKRRNTAIVYSTIPYSFLICVQYIMIHAKQSSLKGSPLVPGDSGGCFIYLFVPFNPQGN